MNQKEDRKKIVDTILKALRQHMPNQVDRFEFFHELGKNPGRYDDDLLQTINLFATLQLKASPPGMVGIWDFQDMLAGVKRSLRFVLGKEEMIRA